MIVGVVVRREVERDSASIPWFSSPGSLGHQEEETTEKTRSRSRSVEDAGDGGEKAKVSWPSDRILGLQERYRYSFLYGYRGNLEGLSDSEVLNDIKDGAGLG